MAAYTLHAIGHVENGIIDLDGVVWEDVESRVVIAPEFAEGLEGIDDFSHIIVLCYLHRRAGEEDRRLQVHPEGREDLPLVGVFATRSPKRPNPIALTVVPLLRREGNVLVVKRLDMADGTPVLDVKPYLTDGDRIEDARVAGWLRRLWDSEGNHEKRE